MVQWSTLRTCLISSRSTSATCPASAPTSSPFSCSAQTTPSARPHQARPTTPPVPSSSSHLQNVNSFPAAAAATTTSVSFLLLHPIYIPTAFHLILEWAKRSVLSFSLLRPQDISVPYDGRRGEGGRKGRRDGQALSGGTRSNVGRALALQQQQQ